MLTDMNLPLILLAFFLAAGSPGPATMAVAGTSMASGRKMGMTLALGVFCGSLTWSFSAAFGLAAIMMAHAWIFEILRYVGAAYLLYLAFVSGRAALLSSGVGLSPVVITAPAKAFRKGLALHLTNPKAILFYGSVYSVGLPPETTPVQLAVVMGSLAFCSFTVFLGYGYLFSIDRVRRGYAKTARVFNGLFAMLFGFVGVRLLTARLV